MDAIKHTYDTESDAYVVPRELMIETMEKLEGAFEYEHEKRMKYMEKLSECRYERSSLKSQLEEIEQKTEHTAYHDLEIESLKKENKKLKVLGEQCDFFQLELHKTLEHQANDCEEYEKQIKELREQLNEESQERLKNKECWMNTQKEYHKLKDQIERERYEHNREIMKQQDKHYLEEVSPMEKQIAELDEENEKLKKENENSKAFWECFMDCKGNPDNPTKAEMIQWCDDNNKSDEIREYITEYADDSDSDDEE